jgi:biopolymer transport protein ExbD
MTTTWQARHEGSPQSVDLPLADLIEGLRDGQWQVTDEVRGPGENTWVAIEEHPKLADVVADLEPLRKRTGDEETRLDMNALIDVTLVLLIFFILTTSYAALQKRLEAPSVSRDKAGVPVFTKKKVEETMIHLTAKTEGGRTVIRVENNEVEPFRLIAELRRYAKSSQKTELLFEHDDEVPHGEVVDIIDKAKLAGLDRIRLLVP